ncbi:hypothetical protein GGTG_03476 [Gaeumannomyces tritici R3-111a-1]|uniref:Uncharacterized protein n=1 Tax=Gaeumannomyces tritici (strain R3-111a-1) TaxID=644352 RepID=J3NQB9_GAET3|nr:hypothetical protein GGTG_03476 [Gaeumannomyces tritici R3-111a-1]EJT78375.1 hypothetical protein GGTG_03476 [Gaeumannomyces tritici R3-111a-1]
MSLSGHLGGRGGHAVPRTRLVIPAAAAIKRSHRKSQLSVFQEAYVRLRYLKVCQEHFPPGLSYASYACSAISAV